MWTEKLNQTYSYNEDEPIYLQSITGMDGMLAQGGEFSLLEGYKTKTDSPYWVKVYLDSLEDASLLVQPVKDNVDFQIPQPKSQVRLGGVDTGSDSLQKKLLMMKLSSSNKEAVYQSLKPLSGDITSSEIKISNLPELKTSIATEKHQILGQ